MKMARCEFLTWRESVLLLGNSRAGKKHIALALQLTASQGGHRVLLNTMPRWSSSGQTTALWERKEGVRVALSPDVMQNSPGNPLPLRTKCSCGLDNIDWLRCNVSPRVVKRLTFITDLNPTIRGSNARQEFRASFHRPFRNLGPVPRLCCFDWGNDS